MKYRAFLTTAYLLIAVAPVQAVDIINTLAGYHGDSWAATGPEAQFYGTYWGDTDIAWQFSNNSAPHFLTMVTLPLATWIFCPGHIADISVWSDKVVVYGHVPDQMLETVTINTVPIDHPALCTAFFSGGAVLDSNTYYWVALSAPGTEMVKWYQNADIDEGWGAYRKDMSEWVAPLAGGYAGAMRVVGDPAPPCVVEFEDFARFAAHWLETGCDSGNSWCGGADLDQLGDVNETDLSLFVDYWLLNCPGNWPLK